VKVQYGVDMHSFLFRLFSIIFILSLTFSAQATSETYKLDPSHSYVLWHINHFGFSNPSGKWMADGTIIVDESKPQNAKVSINIPVGNIITGIPKLDEHLKTAEFFDVDKFPTATFVSNKITLTSKDTAKMQGILTLHGISKPITLNVKLNKIGDSPITHKRTAGFTATAQLKRSDYGIKTYLPGLGDDVKLNIEVEAFKDTTDKT
jgi:polyisoprenoid-binding protein YceI